MTRLHRGTGALALACLLLAGCKGKEASSLETMYLWAKALQVHLVTDAVGGYTVPATLDQLDPTVTSGFARADAWGNPLVYRAVRDDRYQLISAGPDGAPGNADDLILENGSLKNAAQVYAALPLR